MYKHLLVPMDDSILSGVTVEQAVRFAKELKARLSFVHVRADFAGSSEGALIEVMNPNAMAEVAMGNAASMLAKAESAALTAGVEVTTFIKVGNKPHKVILDTAAELGCDLIFMASHGRRGINGIIHGSVTQKILQDTTVPVLVSQVESNKALSPEERAVTIIKNEHRSLAAVIREMMNHLTDVQKGIREPDFKLYLAMIFYIEDYSQKLHHPKEDRYLFNLLRTRTNDFNSVMDELESQHVQEHNMLIELRQLLADFVEGKQDAGAAFTERFDRFVQYQWHHMKLEEELIIPSAREYLNDSDWKLIIKAFEENGDPQFEPGIDTSFEQLFTRLINKVAGA